jgi:hypothetical protein
MCPWPGATDAAGPVNLVMDERLRHERFGNSSNPALNGYGAEYNNRRSKSISYMPDVASTSGRLYCEILRILFLQAHRETHRFFAGTGVETAQQNQDRFRRAAFTPSSNIRSATSLPRPLVLRINLNIDVAPVASRAHTHPPTRKPLAIYSLASP